MENVEKRSSITAIKHDEIQKKMQIPERSGHWIQKGFLIDKAKSDSSSRLNI